MPVSSPPLSSSDRFVAVASGHLSDTARRMYKCLQTTHNNSTIVSIQQIRNQQQRRAHTVVVVSRQRSGFAVHTVGCGGGTVVRGGECIYGEGGVKQTWVALMTTRSRDALVGRLTLLQETLTSGVVERTTGGLTTVTQRMAVWEKESTAAATRTTMTTTMVTSLTCGCHRFGLLVTSLTCGCRRSGLTCGGDARQEDAQPPACFCAA